MNWLKRLFASRRLDRELDTELEDHFARLTADFVALGMSETEARRQARVRFGGAARVKDECRDARGTRWLEDAIHDGRYALRMFRSSPTFTAVAICSLALAIGANTAIFSLVDAVLLETLPVRAPSELVIPVETTGSQQTMVWSTTDTAALRTSTALSGLCAFRPAGFRLATPAGPESVQGQLMSGNCMSVLGIRPLLGRLLSEADEGHPVAVVSHALWQRLFGASASAVGRTIEVEGIATTIVGVTRPDFLGLESGRRVDLTLPLAPPFLTRHSRLLTSPNARWIRLIGRLARDTSPQAAQAELQQLWHHARVQITSKAPESRLALISGAQGVNELRRDYAFPLRMLMLAVGVLLALACANLGSLLLARNHARQHELALRLSLGATRGRVVRQLITEALLLSLAGAIVGLAFARWGSDAIVSLLSRGRTPIVLDLTMDFRVIGFTAIAGLATGLVLGTFPAFFLRRRSLTYQLQTSTRATTPGQRFRGAAPIAVQAALSLVLVTAAGLFAGSLLRLHRVDVGFEKDGVLLIGAPADRKTYPGLLARLESLPTVRTATLTMDTPLGGLSWSSGLSFPGADASAKPVQAYFNFVGPRYFETFGIPLVEGRDFRQDDDERAMPSAVVNHAFARRHFRGKSAIGERLLVGQTGVEIVGVAKDVRHLDIRRDPPDMVYRPYRQQPDGYGLNVAVRATMAEPALADIIRHEVRAAAPSQPPGIVRSLDAQYDGSIASDRLLAMLSGFLGTAALLLVAIGIYGTLSYGVVRRRRELGVRLALGANRRDIVRLVLAGALTPIVIGVAIGVPLSLIAGRVAQATLFGIAPTDPATYLVCIAALLGVAVCAAWLPSYRAARTDPILALHQD